LVEYLGQEVDGNVPSAHDQDGLRTRDVGEGPLHGGEWGCPGRFCQHPTNREEVVDRFLDLGVVDES
jgi:hypothetical protein